MYSTTDHTRGLTPASIATSSIDPGSDYTTNVQKVRHKTRCDVPTYVHRAEAKFVHRVLRTVRTSPLNTRRSSSPLKVRKTKRENDRKRWIGDTTKRRRNDVDQGSGCRNSALPRSFFFGGQSTVRSVPIFGTSRRDKPGDGWQRRYTNSLPHYCRPGDLAIANHPIHHGVHNQISRRPVASGLVRGRMRRRRSRLGRCSAAEGWQSPR